MSRKWQRAKQWDRQNLTGPLLPLRWILGAFSSIRLAIVLLTLVAIFGVLASVPIGLLALAPTWAVYLLTVLLAIGLGVVPAAVLPVRSILHRAAAIPIAIEVLIAAAAAAAMWWGASTNAGLASTLETSALITGLALLVGAVAGIAIRKSARTSDQSMAVLPWLARVFLGVAGAVLAATLWHRHIWPVLHYDPAHGSGLRFFADFVEANKDITLRRLPFLEMTEIEFYSWWPLPTVLALFVINMMVATVRRIEFRFENLGVLTVHTGIVLLALGSVLYGRAKTEGDMLLRAGVIDVRGEPQPGPVQDVYYDRIATSLWLSQGPQWEQRPLRGVPRYNSWWPVRDGGESLLEKVGRAEPPRSAGLLSIPVPPRESTLIDPDVHVRIVGYEPYAQPMADHVLDVAPGSLQRGGKAGDERPELRNPVLFAAIRSYVQGADGRVISRMFLPLDEPAARASEQASFAIEAVRNVDARWRDVLTRSTSAGGYWLAVSGSSASDAPIALLPLVPGQKTTLANVAELDGSLAGWTVECLSVDAEPTLAIVTEGFRGATSSMAVVRVTDPSGQGFERWVYSRFPRIAQDMLDQRSDQGMPVRRAADPRIELWMIDATKLRATVIVADDGRAEAIVREPTGDVRVHGPIEIGGRFILAGLAQGERLEVELAELWRSTTRIERPVAVPKREQDRQFVGNHEKSMLAVEVSLGLGRSDVDRAWRSLAWVPYSRFFEPGLRQERVVELPDGRRLQLAFAPRAYRLPGFALQLVDFAMESYDHRGAPRDYRSTLRVLPSGEGGMRPDAGFEHVASLNAPLRAPFMWSSERGWLGNVAGTLAAGLNPRQLKFSQAGWDAEGWRQTQEAVDRGELARPSVRFTILGVGNNPGIHIVALGGVLMGLGIPWAFYVKPWLLRRRSRKLRAQHATAIARNAAVEAHQHGPPQPAQPIQPTPSGHGSDVVVVAVDPARTS